MSGYLTFCRGVLDTTLCEKVRQWLATGQRFFPCTPVSSTNKTDCHNIPEILLNVVLNTINHILFFVLIQTSETTELNKTKFCLIDICMKRKNRTKIVHGSLSRLCWLEFWNPHHKASINNTTLLNYVMQILK